MHHSYNIHHQTKKHLSLRSHNNWQLPVNLLLLLFCTLCFPLEHLWHYMQCLQNHLASQIEHQVCKRLGLENRGNGEVKSHIYGKCHIHDSNDSKVHYTNDQTVYQSSAAILTLQEMPTHFMCPLDTLKNKFIGVGKI